MSLWALNIGNAFAALLYLPLTLLLLLLVLGAVALVTCYNQIHKHQAIAFCISRFVFSHQRALNGGITINENENR